MPHGDFRPSVSVDTTFAEPFAGGADGFAAPSGDADPSDADGEPVGPSALGASSEDEHAVATSSAAATNRAVTGARCTVLDPFD